MTAAVASAAQSLSSLLRQTSLDDHDEILKAANGALKKSKTDTGAQLVKVVALLKLDRYDDALRVLEEGGDQLKKLAQLEYAYALYKTGDLQKAEEVAKEAKGLSRGMTHVEAQATYRLEKFAQSLSLYRELAQQPTEVENEENDLKINTGAADAQLEWAGYGDLVHKKRPSRDDLEAFETAYNAACGSIARGELQQAEFLLQRAKDLCNAAEELSTEDKEAEIVPITIQQMFVLSRLGKTEQAEKLGSEINAANISDPTTKKFAQNNILATNLPENPFLAQRLFNETPELPKNDLPFSFQSAILRQNGYALDLLSMKYPGVARSTASFFENQPCPTTSPSVNSASVVHAAAAAQNQVGKAGLQEILRVLERRPNDVGLILTIIQLYLLTNNHGSAISLLESFFKRLETSTSEADQDVRFAPGLVGLLVSLYRVQGRKAHVRTEFAKSASYWRQKSTAKAPASLLRAAGAALLESSKPEDLTLAGEIFDDLLEREPNDAFAAAGRVAAYSTIQPEKVHSEAAKLPAANRLVPSMIDAVDLEEGGVPRAPAPPVGAGKKRPADETNKPAVKKRFRKSRLPKDYDPSKTPDPERWLPLRDRSTYKPKGKKGKQKAAALTQGGVVTDKVADAGLEPAGVEGKGKSGGGGASSNKSKKKKGKGNKW
ncbi:signal recognition particle protein [Xylona heveae TC161]|uniref:Signal recognition particle subunit SRP72 n=1 Tax=Xylona heveae (strain CBS 132557 / TC161) TaxID=1328760 RepID=A0A165FZP4_XYLHT|nr:signal recognition particle protein [Xylona heveae TC161]KZF21572.1 signal recognition particle protein [Xylona heveae TC161]